MLRAITLLAWRGIGSRHLHDTDDMILCTLASNERSPFIFPQGSWQNKWEESSGTEEKKIASPEDDWEFYCALCGRFIPWYTEYFEVKEAGARTHDVCRVCRKKLGLRRPAL